ncbi:uncharacterized protein [Dermacentor albipictus]|uniref:uncharacterized protein n=1 Tax=Dermacentor albipictus TaxID=60249 RepID=UPI0031FDE159
MLIYVLLVIYFFTGEAQCGKGSTQVMEHSIVRDGWHFFARRLQFVMLKRTYNVTGGLNNSMCIMVPFPPKIDRKQHALNATFTYRNLSSTYKLHPDNTADNTSYWPIAIFQLHFYARNLKGGASVRKTGLDFVNPTTVMRGYGYALSPPFWRIMYCNNRCAVVDVRQITFTTTYQKRGPRKRQCELWISISVGETKQENGSNSKLVICEGFFKRWCDTTNVQNIYNPEMCARKI